MSIIIFLIKTVYPNSSKMKLLIIKTSSTNICNHQKRLKIRKVQLQKRCMNLLSVYKQICSSHLQMLKIQQESKSMDLEKFMYFCIYFQITQLINRQLITEYFKMFSENQRIIDFSKFQKFISKMVKTDPRVAQNLLNKIKFDVQTKKKMINENKKNEGRLSGYKFMLHPINGKDISTIEKELSYRRREEKQKKALVKRQKGQKQESRVSKIPISHSVPRVNCFELEAIRDNSFDPQKFIPSNEKDHLWQAYEDKIWKKEEKSMSALQYILSKRMQRGNQILQKLNSQRSFTKTHDFQKLQTIIKQNLMKTYKKHREMQTTEEYIDQASEKYI